MLDATETVAVGRGGLLQGTQRLTPVPLAKGISS